MAYSNARFADVVRDVLSDSGFPFEQEAEVGGVVADFLVQLPNGRGIVVEAKSWRATSENIQRAHQQVERFRTGDVSDVLVVLPNGPSAPADGVVGVDALVGGLAALGAQAAPVGWLAHSATPTMFCAMPFDGLFDDVYFVAMRGAAEECGLAAVRVDLDEFNGDIVAEIKERIEQAKLVVADLSSARPNVLYEVGYANGRGIPVVAICSTPMNELPFDVAHNNMLQYEPGRTHQLVARLTDRIRSSI